MTSPKVSMRIAIAQILPECADTGTLFATLCRVTPAGNLGCVQPTNKE